MAKCYICPRECGADRERGETGACNSPFDFAVSKIMLHKWEEPCIVGESGAGTIFFSGCNLGCVYCQNSRISRGGYGEIMTERELEGAIFSLVEQGATCIEFVTPTHYTHRLASLLSRVNHKINLPIVWNSGGYEKAESLRLLDGLIDIYMPDFKYFSPEISKKYSCASNYREYALSSLAECVRQVGAPKFKENGMMKSGVILRHLILPSNRADSVAILELIASEIGAKNVLLSLMGQYTPDFYIERAEKCGKEAVYKNLCRRITSFEYNSVLSVADRLGFEGYFQDLSSASRKYTPDF